MMAVAFATAVRVLEALSGEGRDALAERAGISRSVFSAYATGYRVPSPESAAAILVALVETGRQYKRRTAKVAHGE